MNYTVDYFIKKFEATTEGAWCTYSRLNSIGQRCAHGQCYAGSPYESEDNDEEIALCKLAQQLGYDGFGVINNGDDKSYQQTTPKQRVLAALYDIKAKEIQISEVHEVLEHQTVNL